MYTSPQYRRQGIAAHLLGLVIEEAQMRGYRLLRLHASANGRALYERFGFAPSEGYMAMRL